MYLAKSPLERLQDHLDRDLGWRRKELSTLKLAVASNVGDAKNLAIRSGVLLCYSHFEGFVRSAIRRYLELVQSAGLKYEELSHNFLALKLATMVHAGTKKASYYNTAVSFLLLESGVTARLPNPEMLSAHSNLTYERFEELLFCVALAQNSFELKKHFVDEILLDRRNAIAHGQYRHLDEHDFEEIYVGVADIINGVYLLVLTSAIDKAYERPKPDIIIPE